MLPGGCASRATAIEMNGNANEMLFLGIIDFLAQTQQIGETYGAMKKLQSVSLSVTPLYPGLVLRCDNFKSCMENIHLIVMTVPSSHNLKNPEHLAASKMIP